MQENSDSQKALNPTVVKLGLVSFFTDVASEMLYPITPIFLTTVLGASMSSLGLIEGIAEATASLLKLYSGIWSDRIVKRKPFLLMGYFLGAISKPFIGSAQVWSQVLFARVLDRFGKGIRTAPRDAMLADTVIASQRGAAFGWHRAMDTLGAAVGPLLALLFLNYNSFELRSLYFWALIPGLMSVLIAMSLRETCAEPVESLKSKNISLNPFKLWNEFDASFKNYILAWGVFSVANSSDVFLLMRVKDSGLSISAVILLYCGYNLIYAFFSPYFGKLSDRVERKKILSLGLLIYTVVYFGFSQSNTIWQFAGLFFIYGIYMAATEGVGKAFAIDLVPTHLKATAVGILGTVTGVCTILASFLAGLIWDYYGASWAFVYAAVGAIVTIVLLLRVRKP